MGSELYSAERLLTEKKYVLKVASFKILSFYAISKALLLQRTLCCWQIWLYGMMYIIFFLQEKKGLLCLKKNKARQALSEFTDNAVRSLMVMGKFYWQLLAISQPPLSHPWSFTLPLQPLSPVDPSSLDRPARPPPTSRSRAWITGKCVSSHLKLSPGHSPKNNWFCPRGMLGNSSAYINHLLTTYL